MKYSDLSSTTERIKELVIIKLQYFFSDNKIARLIFILSIFLLLWQSYLLLNLFNSYKTWHLPESKPSANIEPAIKSQFTNIASKHIFGEVAKSLGSLSDALKSNLPLTLKGVISYANNSKIGEVIIQDSEGKDKVYSIGDRLLLDSGFITLEYIFKDKIYIKNNGVLEYILYPVYDLKNSNNKPKVNRKTNNFTTRTIRNTRKNNLNSNSIAPAITNQNDDDEDQDDQGPLNLNNTNNVPNNNLNNSNNFNNPNPNLNPNSNYNPNNPNFNNPNSNIPTNLNNINRKEYINTENINNPNNPYGPRSENTINTRINKRPYNKTSKANKTHNQIKRIYN